MRLHETKKLHSRRGSPQNGADKGLITRELRKLNSQRIDDSMKKWATELKELFQKKKYKWKGKKILKKDLQEGTEKN
jgi:hypothetical protein